MKNFILICFFLSISFGLHSQDFKDLYKALPENDRFSNMMDLRAYQSKQPEHVITYFLLADIYNQYMREINPLVMFNVLRSNYNQLYVHYGILKSKLDKKQARQDREYFGNVKNISEKRNVGLEDILNEVDIRMASSKEYFQDAESVHNNYVNCVTKYNECLYKFREILDVFKNSKSLYLLITPQLKSEIENISTSFDSTLIYFNAYNESCDKLPHLLKVDDYQLNEIVTYRLEGLTEADFSQPIVQLWDFKTWADNFIHLMNTDIYSIRKGLLDADSALNMQIAKLQNEVIYSDEHSYYRTEDKFQNLIGKYDYASISNKLLVYRNSKVEYLLKTRSKMNDPYDSLAFNLVNKLWFYKDLADYKIEVNKQADEVMKGVSIEEIAKYINFYSDQYNGMNGLARWCEVEKYNNDLIFNKNLKNLEGFIEQDIQKDCYTDSAIIYKKKEIAFGIQQAPADSFKSDTIVTQGLISFKRNWFYLNGIEYDKTGKSEQFLAKINPKGKVDWMVSPTKSKNDETFIPHAQVMDDSTCWVLSCTKKIINDSIHQIHTYNSKYSWDGKMESKVIIDSFQTPEYYWVDEINEQYLVIFQGNEPQPQTMDIRLYNFNDSMVWQNSFNLKGELIDVVNTNSNFFVTCNYTEFEYANNDTSFTFSNINNGIVGIYIERNGGVKHITEYKINENLSGEFCNKILNNSINLFGKIKNEQSIEGRYFYLLVDELGKPYFSNINDLEFQLVELSDY